MAGVTEVEILEDHKDQARVVRKMVLNHPKKKSQLVFKRKVAVVKLSCFQALDFLSLALANRLPIPLVGDLSQSQGHSNPKAGRLPKVYLLNLAK